VVSLILLHYYKHTSHYQIIDETVVASYPEVDSSNVPGHVELNRERTNSETRANDTTHPRTYSQDLNSVEVEDLFLTLPRPKVSGEDFQDICDIACHTQCAARKACGDRLKRYKLSIDHAIEAVEFSIDSTLQISSCSPKDFHQIYHHMYLLLFLALSTIIHLSVEVYHYIEDVPSGIYVEIEFLDILLTFSQGFIMFIIFGFDIELIIRKLSKLFTLSLRLNQIYLPPANSLEPNIISLCEDFRKYHLQSCICDIAFNLNIQPDARLCSPEQHGYFSGHRLVDWLLQNRLVSSREEGVEFGRNLLYGRVIEHITKEHFFLDNTYYYKFI